MSLKVISDYLKKIFLGNDHSKLKYKKKHKKHYRIPSKEEGKKTEKKNAYSSWCKCYYKKKEKK